jgi:radical SAM protein with 4Fe4S-binding SPASM domain
MDMTPRILNLQAQPPASVPSPGTERGATEPCAPDVRYFPVGDNVVAFDANTLVAVEISKAQHETLTAEAQSTQRTNPIVDAVSENSVLRVSAVNPALLFSGVRPKFDLSPDVTCRQLTLHLSDQCNQRCRYCWIVKKSTAEAHSSSPADSSTPTETAELRRAGVAELRRAGSTQRASSTVDSVSENSVLRDLRVSAVNPAVMTREIAAAALTMFPSDGRDLRIGFFGGEPLLHFGHILDITKMVEQRAAADKTRAVFHLTTNATLVTPVVARFLSEHGFSIIVSCDGPEKLHDAARGAGSHAAMMRGLNMLQQAGCSDRVVLRGTWSKAPAEVLRRLGALNEMCANGLAAGVALEPVAGATYGRALDAEIRSACNWFGIHARSGGTPRWQYLEKTLRRILWQQFRPSECGAGRGYYTVGPTGLIYACHKQQSAEIGRLDASTASTPSTTVHIDESLRQKWLDNRFCARRECSLCWARHVCGGACRSESLEFCGGITHPHAGRCMLMRQIVAEALVLAATLPRATLLRICPHH